MSSLFRGVLTVRFRGRTSFEAKTRKAYSFCMDRDAILNRVKGLRDEIEFLVRENLAYDAYYTHTVKEQHLYVARMQRLEQIKTELDDMKAGKFHEINE